MNKLQKRVELKKEMQKLFEPYQTQIDKILQDCGKDEILKRGRNAYVEYQQRMMVIENTQYSSAAAKEAAKEELKKEAIGNPIIQEFNTTIDALIYRDGQKLSAEKWAVDIRAITRKMAEAMHAKLNELYKQGKLTGISDEEDANDIIKAGNDSHRLSVRGRVALLDMPEIAGTGFSVWAFPIKPHEAFQLHSHHQICSSIVTGTQPVIEEVYDTKASRKEVYLDRGDLRKPGNVVTLYPNEPNAHIIRNENDDPAMTLHFCFFSPQHGLMLSNENAIGLMGPVTATYAGADAPGAQPRNGRTYYYAQHEGTESPSGENSLYGKGGLKPIESGTRTKILPRGRGIIDGLMNDDPRQR